MNKTGFLNIYALIFGAVFMFSACASTQADETPEEETTTEETVETSETMEGTERSGEEMESASGEDEDTVEVADTTMDSSETMEDTSSDSMDTTSSGNTTVDNSSSTSTSTGRIRTEGASYSDGDKKYATSATKFLLTGQDDLSQIDYLEYRIDDGSYQKYDDQTPITLGQEGNQRILYRGVDRVGNIEPENQYSVIIDNNAPDVNHTIKGTIYDRQGNRYVSGNSTVLLKASDQYSGVKSIEYSINDGGFKTYSDGEEIQLTDEGETKIEYRATDNLGNQTEKKTVTVFVDGTAPAVEITSAKALVDIDGKFFTRGDNTFGVKATDQSSGISELLYRVNSEGEFQPYSTRLQFENEGTYTIEAKAIDNVGNEATASPVTFSIDNTPPKSNLEKVSGSTTTGQ